MSDHEVVIDDTCDVSFNTATWRGGAFYGLQTRTFAASHRWKVPGWCASKATWRSRAGPSRIRHDQSRARRGDGNEAGVEALCIRRQRPLSIRDRRLAGKPCVESGGALSTRGTWAMEAGSLEGNSAGTQGER